MACLFFLTARLAYVAKKDTGADVRIQFLAVFTERGLSRPTFCPHQLLESS